MAFQKITESSSLYSDLDRMPVRALLEGINREDRKVAEAVGREIPKIERLVERLVERMRRGGRLFYIGAGTSGRLGVLDASEIPPTYGMPNTLVIGLIAGGDRALRNPVESAEDDELKGWNELLAYRLPDQRARHAGRHRRLGDDTLRDRCLEGGPQAGRIDRLDRLQSRLARGPRGRDRHRAGGRSRVRHRKHPHEERHGAEDGAQHDLDYRHDPAGAGEGQSHGEHAADQPEAGGPGHAHDHGGAGAGRRRGETSPVVARVCARGDRLISPGMAPEPVNLSPRRSRFFAKNA